MSRALVVWQIRLINTPCSVSEIMRLLREQKVEAVEQARHEAELRANDPELEADDLRSRQAYAEAFERQREAEIAREQAKGTSDLLGTPNFSQAYIRAVARPREARSRLSGSAAGQSRSAAEACH